MTGRLSQLAVSIFCCSLTLVSASAQQKSLEIPAGTALRIRMIDKLSSEEAQVNDTFRATLEDPIMVEGRELYPKGADVMGRVVDVHPSGRLSQPGELDLVLVTISARMVASSVRTEPLVIKGESHTKSNATKIGGGAALGAIIGGIAGGGKGAAIGTVVGAGAGTAGAAATGRKIAAVESEAVLSFTTTLASSPTSPLPPSNATPPRRPSIEEDQGPPPADQRAPDQRAADQRPPDIAQEDSGPPPSDNGRPYDNGGLFSLRDRRTIRNCVSEHADALPPSATQRPELPPGSDRQVRRGEVFPSELERQAQPLPLACEDQLPRLSSDQERVVYNGRVLLLDSKGRILDMFYLDDAQ
ncbi:MAG: hypothetical protein DMG91_08690 [Acidobacteria bacterium]|jgi:hypothetical protein|nr:MAG: hypothetical protein DMG91_08690 [Acidobacteriota bacterium]